MKEKPGVMIYFDVLPVLTHLSIEEKGMLFEAILNYAKYGYIHHISHIYGFSDYHTNQILRCSNYYCGI